MQTISSQRDAGARGLAVSPLLLAGVGRRLGVALAVSAALWVAFLWAVG